MKKTKGRIEKNNFWNRPSKFPEIKIKKEDALTLSEMKRLDEYAIKKFHLPIELMMENAGYHLARMVSAIAPSDSSILIGCGKGNNGGGGLVAARRLCGWGYKVFIHCPDIKLRELPALQLTRALAFGAKISDNVKPGLAVDAYLGFSQQFPLSPEINKAVKRMNNLPCPKISLDIPTGLTEDEYSIPQDIIHPEYICTLAAPKKILSSPLLKQTKLFVADIGIPLKAFSELNLKNVIPFSENSLCEFKFV